MAKLDLCVKIPEIPGLITRKIVRGGVYIYYEYSREYFADRKYTVPKRACIGRLNPDGTMTPNDNFAKYLPELLPGAKQQSKVSGCLRVGAFFIVRKIVEDYGLFDKLGREFNYGELMLFIDLAAYSLISEDNAAQHYPDYTYNHPVFTDGMKRFSDSKISTFFKFITFEQIAGFLEIWNKGRDRKERIYISYDATNKNCQAENISIAEFGHAKDDRSEPIFNYAIAYDQNNCEPLFYEEYSGSIVDVSQLQCMIAKALGYGYENVGFVLDRGYFSKANIMLMDELSLPYVLAVKGMHSLVSSIVDGVRGTFEHDRKSFVSGFRTYGKTAKRKLYAEDRDEKYFHVFFSIERAHREQDSLEETLESAARFMERQENTEAEFSKWHHKFFDIIYDRTSKVFLYAKEREDVISRELDLCGYFVIVTSEKMTAAEALKIYKGRDSTEKLFRADKSFLGNQSMRVCSDESLSAKMFIEFVALIVRNRIHFYLKNAKMKNEKKRNFMNVPAAIRELEKIEMIRRPDGKYTLDHAVTATQKEILGAFGLDEMFIKQNASKLSGEIFAIEKEARDEG